MIILYFWQWILTIWKNDNRGFVHKVVLTWLLLIRLWIDQLKIELDWINKAWDIIWLIHYYSYHIHEHLANFQFMIYEAWHLFHKIGQINSRIKYKLIIRKTLNEFPPWEDFYAMVFFCCCQKFIMLPATGNRYPEGAIQSIFIVKIIESQEVSCVYNGFSLPAQLLQCYYFLICQITIAITWGEVWMNFFPAGFDREN